MGGPHYRKQRFTSPPPLRLLTHHRSSVTPLFIMDPSAAAAEKGEAELVSMGAAATPEVGTPKGYPGGGGGSKASLVAIGATRFLIPIGTPMKRALMNMKGYLEEAGHLTKLKP